MRKITWIATLALAASLGCTKTGTTETSGMGATGTTTAEEDRQNQSGTTGSTTTQSGTTGSTDTMDTGSTSGTTGSTATGSMGTDTGTGTTGTGTTDTGTTGSDTMSTDRQNQAGSMTGMTYKISRVDTGTQEVVLVPHHGAAKHGGTDSGTTGTGTTDREMQSGTELRLSFDDIRRLAGKDASGSGTTTGDVTSSLREGGMVQIIPVGSSAPTSASDIQSIKMKDKKHDKKHEKGSTGETGSSSQP